MSSRARIDRRAARAARAGDVLRPEMVRRYAHFSAEHLAPYADRLCALRVVEGVPNGTISSQLANDSECSDGKLLS